jgi:hypothetical protein
MVFQKLQNLVPEFADLFRRKIRKFASQHVGPPSYYIESDVCVDCDIVVISGYEWTGLSVDSAGCNISISHGETPGFRLSPE